MPKWIYTYVKMVCGGDGFGAVTAMINFTKMVQHPGSHPATTAELTMATRPARFIRRFELSTVHKMQP